MDMACREEETVPMQIQKNDEKEACRELPMRSEQQMYDIILGYAESEEQVRLVTLEGSRTNRNILPDEFQDYDITFFVTDMDSFTADDAWLDVFGKRLLSTYRMGSYGEMWTALEQCMTLFRKVSKRTACLLGYPYPEYDEKISGYVDFFRKKFRL